MGWCDRRDGSWASVLIPKNFVQVCFLVFYRYTESVKTRSSYTPRPPKKNRISYQWFLTYNYFSRVTKLFNISCFTVTKMSYMDFLTTLKSFVVSKHRKMAHTETPDQEFYLISIHARGKIRTDRGWYPRVYRSKYASFGLPVAVLTNRSN